MVAPRLEVLVTGSCLFLFCFVSTLAPSIFFWACATFPNSSAHHNKEKNQQRDCRKRKAQFLGERGFQCSGGWQTKNTLATRKRWRQAGMKKIIA